tara:strand:+ start:4682 stop:5047 length:366 start_codon:yes stop_codon:yes gene_type:complete
MSDKMNAAILLLRSKAVETLGMIRELDAKPAEEGDAEKITELAQKFVQYEGAMISLQQMIRPQRPMPQDQAPMPQPPPSVEKSNEAKKAITEEDLKVRSPTYRRSQSVKRNTKKKVNKDES